MLLGLRTIWVPLVLFGCSAGNPTRLDQPCLPSGPEYISTASPPATMPLADLEFVVASPTVFYGSLIGRPTDAYGRSILAPQSPCVVEPLKVFESIPEYLRIRTSSLDDKDPEYWILLAKANDKFYAAVRKAVREIEVYDIVFRYGHVRPATTSRADGVPDITDEVLKRLEP